MKARLLSQLAITGLLILGGFSTRAIAQETLMEGDGMTEVETLETTNGIETLETTDDLTEPSETEAIVDETEAAIDEADAIENDGVTPTTTTETVTEIQLSPAADQADTINGEADQPGVTRTVIGDDDIDVTTVDPESGTTTETSIELDPQGGIEVETTETRVLEDGQTVEIQAVPNGEGQTQIEVE